jgi:hypothetical protein
LFDLYGDAPVAAAAAERIVAVCRKAIPVSAQAVDSTALPAVSTLLARGIKAWSHHRGAKFVVAAGGMNKKIRRK